MLLVECLRGAYCDMEMLRTAALRSEMGQLRSQAVHRASRLETLVEEHHSADRPWSALVSEQWLKSFWSAHRLDQQHQLYAAVVAPACAAHANTRPPVPVSGGRPDTGDGRSAAAGTPLPSV